jgi:hypothetical protein
VRGRLPTPFAAGLLPILALTWAACATPSTKKIELDPRDIAAEEARQRRIVLADHLEQQRRLTDVAYPILRAAAPLCGEDVGRRAGVLFNNMWSVWTPWASCAGSRPARRGSS